MNEVVDVKNFIRSTRDSGYRNLALALAELIDNSIQAGASHIDISIPSDSEPQEDRIVSVLDNGCGMSASLILKSLAFGGSNRYDSRAGLGRFGMGLPNSSLSQARRLEVFSWTRKGKAKGAALDLDRLLKMDSPSIERIPSIPQPVAALTCCRSGTMVRWLRLDRLNPRSWRKEGDRLHQAIGRIFRHLLAQGIIITLNGQPVQAFDPLMLHQGKNGPFSRPYGDALVLDVGESFGLGTGRGMVTIRFSELDVLRLSHLSASEKRSLGIVGGAGISVIRANREIDYRWVFITKRKENYDEWWRCEITFDPILDEAFGVTNTKQGIRPCEKLRAILAPQITGIVRVLNSRARTFHAQVAATRFTPEEIAAQRVQCALGGQDGQQSRWITASSLQVVSRKVSSTCLVHVEKNHEETNIILNENHPFHQVFYTPLMAGKLSASETVQGVNLLLLAIGRSRADKDSSLDGLLRLFFRGLA